MKIFKVCFTCADGTFVDGFTEAESLAEAMKRIAEAYPDISQISWIYEQID